MEWVSHELGHYKYCVDDEYTDSGTGPQWQCGHSNRANPWGDQNNFCVDFDHRKDKTLGAANTSLSSVMSQAISAGTALESHNVTFDNFDYDNFDFNSVIGNVVIQ